jgi:hypothetical protein
MGKLHGRLSGGSEASYAQREQAQSARKPGYFDASRHLNSSIDVDVPLSVRYTVKKVTPFREPDSCELEVAA